MSDDETFQQGDAGSADTIPTQAGSIKKGGYCMLKGFPCKVNDYSTAKPGKHGSAKATIVGTDIFTGKKHEDSCPTSHNMQVPIVNKIELQVADIDNEKFVSFILEDGSLKENLKLPADQAERAQLQKIWQNGKQKGQVYFTITTACKQQKIVSGRIKQY